MIRNRKKNYKIYILLSFHLIFNKKNSIEKISKNIRKIIWGVKMKLINKEFVKFPFNVLISNFK